MKFKACNCSKSQCLQLYCECFRFNGVCSSKCKCLNCKNKIQFTKEREQAIKAVLMRDPDAFTDDELNTEEIL